MKVREICKLLEATVVCGNIADPHRIERGFSSDLMSDVLTLDTENLLLITGMCNLQTLRTAEMADIRFIVIVRNKRATDEMIVLAENIGICLLESPYSSFKSCGILYMAGLKPVY